jgi:hypothetical protein
LELAWPEGARLRVAFFKSPQFRRDVAYWQILLQKSFCITEDKFSGP